MRTLVTGVIWATVLFFSSTATTQAKPETRKREWANPNKLVNDAAKQASQGDEQSLELLAKSILDYPRAFPKPAAPVALLLQNRLARAELAFRNGKIPGIKESDLVDLVNTYADRLQAPVEARTTESQIRILRMRLLLGTPLLMGTGMAHSDMKIGESISDTLSPMQAFHLLSTLVDQKLINPEYQVPPDDWEVAHHSPTRLKLEQLQREHTTRQQNHEVSRGTIEVKQGEKATRMRETLDNKLVTLSVGDAIELVEIGFRKLRLNE